MIQKKSFLMYMIASLLLITACNRQEEEDNQVQAGKGGNAVLKLTPQHHGLNIDSCTFYIKYNAQNVSSTYDDSVVCVMENGKPTGTFSNLHPGKYYIYGKGYDPAILQEVTGGIPIQIKEEKTMELYVPVTEVH